MSHKGPGRMFDEKSKKVRDIDDKTLMKWMFRYLTSFKYVFIGLTGLLFLFTVASAFIPMIQQKMIDDGILAFEWGITLNYIIWIAIFTVISTIGSGFVNYKVGKLGTEVIYKVRMELFENLQNMSMDYYDKHHSGDIISIATNDVDQMNLIFGGQLAQTISDAFRGILMMVLMLIMNWELALLSFLIIPVFLLFMKNLRKVARKKFKKTRQAISEVTQKAEENISGMKVIQAYGKQQSAADEFDEANLKNQKALLNTRKIFAFYIPMISFIGSIFSAIILLYGGYGIINGVTILGNTITLGVLQAMSNYLTQLFMPIMSVAMFQQNFEAAFAAGERIYKLLHEQTEITNSESPVEFDNPQGNINFKKITFSYSQRQSAIPKNLSSEEKLLLNLPLQQRERLQNLQKMPKEKQNQILAQMTSAQKNHISEILSLLNKSTQVNAKEG